MVVAVLIGGLFIYGGFIQDNGEKEYTLETLHYNVEILPNGDAAVREDRTYHFSKGEFSRGFFTLEEGVENIQVYERDQPYKKLAAFDAGRTEGTYAFKKEGGLTNLEWYYRAKEGETKEFTIQYKVKQAVTSYEDSAIYFQKFLSEKNQAEIGILTARVQLPKGSNRDNTLIWGHGPSHGNLEFDPSNPSIVNFILEDVPPGEYVEARFVLDKNLMPNNQYVEAGMKRDAVIQEETIAAKEADRKALIAGLSALFAWIISGGLILGTIFIRVKNKYFFTRFKPEIQPDYYRDIPEEVYPAVLDQYFYFYNKKKSIPREISATIMDLIYKGFLEISYEQEGTKQETWLRKKDTLEGKKKLASFEKTVVDFIFRDIGNNAQAVSLKEIKKFCKKKKNGKAIGPMLDRFEGEVDRTWQRKGYVEREKNRVPKIFLIFKILSIAIAVGGFALLITDETLSMGGAGIVLLIGGALSFGINLIVNHKKKMLNQGGENKLALWRGFNNFLEDFTTFEEKDMPELFMWQRYLVYATALGVAEKVLKKLKLRYPQLQDQAYLRENMYFLYSMNMGNTFEFEGFNDLSDSINSAIRDAQNVVENIRSSSSKGGGGGFSSGGSSGGSGAGGSTGGGMD